MVWPTLNEGQNNYKYHKNRCPWLPLKWVSKSTLSFQFWESRQKCIISTLVWPTLNEGQNSSKYHKHKCPYISLKWVPKSTFKTQFRDTRQKCIFSTLVWPTLNEVQNNSKSHKNGCPCLSLKWVLNSISKLNSEKVDSTASFQHWFELPWTRAKRDPNLIKRGVHAYL